MKLEVATQVEQRVHLHRRLGRSQTRPETPITQIDGRRVQRIDSAGQIHVQIDLVFNC